MFAREKIPTMANARSHWLYEGPRIFFCHMTTGRSINCRSILSEIRCSYFPSLCPQICKRNNLLEHLWMTFCVILSTASHNTRPLLEPWIHKDFIVCSRSYGVHKCYYDIIWPSGSFHHDRNIYSTQKMEDGDVIASLESRHLEPREFGVI